MKYRDILCTKLKDASFIKQMQQNFWGSFVLKSMITIGRYILSQTKMHYTKYFPGVLLPDPFL